MEHLRTLATAALQDRGCTTAGDGGTHSRDDAAPLNDAILDSSDVSGTVVQLATHTTTNTAPASDNALVPMFPSRSSKRKLEGGHDKGDGDDEFPLVEGGEGSLTTENGLGDQRPSKRARKTQETEAGASTDSQVSRFQPTSTVAGVDDASTPTTSQEGNHPATATPLEIAPLRSDNASINRYPDQQSSALPPAPAPSAPVSSAVRTIKVRKPVLLLRLDLVLFLMEKSLRPLAQFVVQCTHLYVQSSPHCLHHLRQGAFCPKVVNRR